MIISLSLNHIHGLSSNLMKEFWGYTLHGAKLMRLELASILRSYRNYPRRKEAKCYYVLKNLKLPKNKLNLKL